MAIHPIVFEIFWFGPKWCSKCKLTESLFADIPLSVGILEPRSHPLHLNTIEFLWDPVKNASVFIQVQGDSGEMSGDVVKTYMTDMQLSNPFFAILLRSTASAPSLPPGSMEGRKECLFVSRWTLSPPMNTGNTWSTSTLPAARSKCSRYETLYPYMFSASLPSVNIL